LALGELPGPLTFDGDYTVTRKLQTRYDEVVHGRNKNYEMASLPELDNRTETSGVKTTLPGATVYVKNERKGLYVPVIAVVVVTLA
jgi:hypothetical protein